MFACTEKAVYCSGNFGENWEKKLDVAGNWHAISMSENGQYGSVIGLDEGIYITSDYGNSWVRSRVDSGSSWVDVDGDKSGQYLVLAGLGEGIFTSSDYGVSWFKSNAPPLMWKSVSSDRSGRFLIAATPTDGIYVSFDRGALWAATMAPKIDWALVVVESDNICYGFAKNNRNLFWSTNRGHDWEEITVNVQDKVSKVLSGNLSLKVHLNNGSQPTVPSALIIVSTTNPTSLPTSRPTAGPTAHPTTHPISHSLLPTLPPTEFAGILIDAYYVLNGVTKEYLDNSAIKSIVLTVYNTTWPPPRPTDVAYLGYSDLPSAYNYNYSYSYITYIRIFYDMDDYPSYTSSSLATTITNSIKTSVNTGNFTLFLRTNAQTNQASSLYGASVPNVTVTVFLPSSSEDDNSLNVGEVVAIVICSVFGFVLIIAGVWYFIFKSGFLPREPLRASSDVAANV